ncbi:hypothetical protein OA57_02230 [Chelonobacter oris]|uniref:Phospholipase/carboxylesterase/thioesterase domain-containing protein n=1 Tax=Chelonobacter oris TaxID=505317 RepID=A0A0A3AU84_9PAST|nr:hypothetical protein OA57_02230 [Chelonobacter oris]
MFIAQNIDNVSTKLLKFDKENLCQIQCKPHFSLKFNTPIRNIEHKVMRNCHFLAVKCLETDKFADNIFKDIRYCLYSPEKQGKNPLILFLHGAGEGGLSQNHLLADRSVATFVDPDIQHYFDYPYILAPQCPDFWLDTFTLAGKTYYGSRDYTETIFQLVRKIIRENKWIDVNRVYVIGASMGGYQALRLLSYAPDIFAAGIIACPAKIPSDNQLEPLKKIPLWLLHSRHDQIVPVQHTDYIVKYLKDSRRIQVTYYADIHIQAITLDPHCVFLALYENSPDFEGISLFHWLTQQRRTL